MKKLIWVFAALGLAALLKKRADQVGSVPGAVASLKDDLLASLAEKVQPNAPTLWARLTGPGKADQQ